VKIIAYVNVGLVAIAFVLSIAAVASCSTRRAANEKTIDDLNAQRAAAREGWSSSR
jgi:hypothetical protein